MGNIWRLEKTNYLKWMNRQIKKQFKNNYDDLFYKIDDRTINKANNKLMMSFSSFTKWNSNMLEFTIPRQILSEVRVIGEEVMEALCFIFNKKCSDLDKVPFLSEKVKDITISLLNELILNDYKIESVEQLIYRGLWYGYVDLVVFDRKNQKRMLLEIKTRGNDEVKTSDKLQLGLYMCLCNCNAGNIWVVNRKTLKITKYVLKLTEAKKLVKEYINKPLLAFNHKEYLINTKISDCYKDTKLVNKNQESSD